MTDVILGSGCRIGGDSRMMREFLMLGARVADLVPRTPQKVPTDRRVRVLVVVHGWFPALAAGSERMMQHLIDALPRDEFEIEVLSFGVGEEPTRETEYVHEGNHVTRGFFTEFQPDVIVTHHGPSARVVPVISEEHPNAAVVVVHHNERYDTGDLLRLEADLNVFNTNWVGESLGVPGIVVHPPLEYDRHRVETTGDKVMMANLQDNKGIAVFTELARRMPEFAFLGLLGTHGEQLTPDLPNVTIHPVTQDMREVWRQTKVVLMPSGYESYGMVAAEAQVSGIPVIAAPTPGLIECLDDAGLFIPRGLVDHWEQALRLLLTDPESYRVHSRMAYLRGRELASQSQTELSEFVSAVRDLVR